MSVGTKTSTYSNISGSVGIASGNSTSSDGFRAAVAARASIKDTADQHIAPIANLQRLKKAESMRGAIPDGSSSVSALRHKVSETLDNGRWDAVMSIVIVFNMILLIIETNDVAVCVTKGLPTEDCGRLWIDRMDNCLLGLYTAEMALRMYAHRRKYFRYFANQVDFANVVLGWLDVVCHVLSQHILPSTQILRMVRLLRLTRAVRLLSTSRELFEMIQGFINAVRAMLWGFLMICLLLTIFAILSVELIHPITDEVVFLHADVDMCNESFSSVAAASLMYFKTLMAGDSWGACAIPIIQQAPWSLCIFSASFVFINLGFTNLILSVIVQRATEAHESDVAARLEEKIIEKRRAEQKLLKILEAVDENKDGKISLGELTSSLDANDDMKVVLQMLNIHKEDLPMLVTLMDADCSGDLSYAEFTDVILRAEARNSNLQQMIIKLQLLELARAIRESVSDQNESLNRLTGALLAHEGNGEPIAASIAASNTVSNSLSVNELVGRQLKHSLLSHESVTSQTIQRNLIVTPSPEEVYPDRPSGLPVTLDVIGDKAADASWDILKPDYRFRDLTGVVAHQKPSQPAERLSDLVGAQQKLPTPIAKAKDIGSDPPTEELAEFMQKLECRFNALELNIMSMLTDHNTVPIHQHQSLHVGLTTHANNGGNGTSLKETETHVTSSVVLARLTHATEQTERYLKTWDNQFERHAASILRLNELLAQLCKVAPESISPVAHELLIQPQFTERADAPSLRGGPWCCSSKPPANRQPHSK